MEWITNNWIWLLIPVLFIAMNLFGYGCCGKGKNSEKGSDQTKADTNSCCPDESTPKKGGGCCG